MNANLTGEMKDYERVRNDAIEAEAKLADIEACEKAMLAEHLANAERAAFDAEKRAFADQAAALAGRLSVEWTDPDNPNKLPEPSLELEGDSRMTGGSGTGTASQIASRIASAATADRAAWADLAAYPRRARQARLRSPEPR